MKRILSSILLILICYLGYGQTTYPIQQNIGSATTLVKTPNYGGLQAGLIPYTFADTTAANVALSYLKNYNGALIYTSGDSALWFRSSGASKWTQILPAGGGSGNNAWTTRGNDLSGQSFPNRLGTKNGDLLNIITSDLIRMIIPAGGIVRSSSAQNKFLVIDTVGKEIYYTDGGGTTPTWQQTLTAGSTLTGDNTIAGGGNGFVWNNLNAFQVNATDDIALTTTNSNINWVVQATNGHAAIYATNTLNGHNSFLYAFTDSIVIIPNEGILKIDTLNNETFQNSLMGWTTTTGANRGKVGYITLGTGLSLSSGVLTAPGSLTATYLGYGSGSNTLTGDANLTYTAASSAVTVDSGMITLTGNKDFGSTSQGTIYKNSNSGLVFRGVVGASYDLAFISTGGTGLFANPTGTTKMGTVGDWGFGLLGSTISAKVHIAAGSATASTAPLKFTSGTNLTTAEAGAVEYNGSNFFMTATAANRRQVALSNVATPTSGYLLVGNGTDYTITAPGSVTGLPYIALTGTSTLTGATTVDINDNDFTISESGAGTHNILLSANTGQSELTIDGTNKTITLNANTSTVVTSAGVQFSAYGAGALTTDGSGNITPVSDRNAKHNIQSFNYGLNSILGLKTSSFIYNQDKSNTLMSGFIAQDVQRVIPIAVHKGKDGMLSLETNAILAALVNSVKELKELNDKQQKEINTLKQIIKNK